MFNLLLIWVVALSGPAGDARPAMEAMLKAVSEAYTASLDEGRFTAPGERERIDASLQALATHAGGLRAHGASRGLMFEFLGEAIERDAVHAREAYRKEDFESARRLVRSLTENCFHCHSRMPGREQPELGRRFIESADLAVLTLPQKARLAVAARQFDSALATYEAILRASYLSPGTIYFMGAFESYLSVAIGARRDLDRATAALARFSERPDLPRYLSDYVEVWRTSLAEMNRSRPRKGRELIRAKEQIAEGQRLQPFIGGRNGLVRYVAAVGLINEYLDGGPRPAVRQSEAYYLLGVAESNVASTWSPQGDVYLEAAIRIDPDSVFARKAYLHLEEVTLRRYAGSAGIIAPPEVMTHLERLRALIDAS